MHREPHGETVVVSGATGFLGRALVGLLSTSNQVNVLTRNRERAQGFFDLDQTRVHQVSGEPGSLVELVQAIAPTAVFHLAAKYERTDPPDPGALIDANVRFGGRLLMALADLDQCDVVVAGSSFEYADADGGALSMYALTKRQLIEVARYLGRSSGLRWIEAVLFDTYGADDDRGKLIDSAVQRILEGQELRLPAAPLLHHFVHANDVADGLLSSLMDLRTGSSGRSVFLTSDAPVSPADVVNMIGEVSGIRPRVSADPYPILLNQSHHLVDGPRPAGWSPIVDLRSGLAEVVEHYRQEETHAG